MGLVIERERLPEETDALRYYCKDISTLLYQKTFHCNDLGQELGPIIKTYFASEEYATDCPKADSIMPLPFKEVVQRLCSCDFLEKSALR